MGFLGGVFSDRNRNNDPAAVYFFFVLPVFQDNADFGMIFLVQ